jgi:hypothetical protein
MMLYNQVLTEFRKSTQNCTNHWRAWSTRAWIRSYPLDVSSIVPASATRTSPVLASSLVAAANAGSVSWRNWSAEIRNLEPARLRPLANTPRISPANLDKGGSLSPVRGL